MSENAMSENANPKPAAPRAIDLYDDRIRAILETWKAEIAGGRAREQAEFAEWRREQQKWTSYWSGGNAGKDSGGGEQGGGGGDSGSH